MAGAGDAHMLVVLHRGDDASGAGGHTAHAADAPLLVDSGHAIDDPDRVILTGLDTVAEAQAAVLAGQR